MSKKKIDHDPAVGGMFSSFFRKRSSSAILLPPDLVSSASDKVRENHEDAKLNRQQQVLPEVTGASVIIEDGNRWLRVETGPQDVWDRLVEFWAEQQIGLVESQPAAGLMETDWIDRNAPSEGEGLSIARLFSRITGAGTLLDKFRIRIERESDRITRVFVSHRSTERKEINLSSRKNSELEWVSGQSDEREAQLLQVLVQLFVGLKESA
ncbi:MAG: outer membrane protein assembly factor BamC [Gammaproteobacteria bacterium]|nr:outer membrane protein assembly factor BamC [Gammaproteobacteria bacterium]